MPGRIIASTVLACCAAVAGPAPAAVSIIGNGLERACYEAAERNRAERPSLKICNAALQDKAQSARNRASTLVNRGIVHMQARDIAAALKDYDAALVIDHELAEAYVNKGIALVHLGDHDAEAVIELTKGLDLHPSKPEVAFYTRAIAYEMTGAARQAYEDYQQAAQLAPEWAEPQIQLRRFSIVRKPTARI